MVSSTNRDTLQGIVVKTTQEGTTVYSDKATAYKGMPSNQESVRHSLREYVRNRASVNGVESFWATMKRGYMGVYHKMSPVHLHRYVCELAGRHNIRDRDTIDQMRHVVAHMAGKRLIYKVLTGREIAQ